ncbi:MULTISPECIES: ABC transporter ATP-binding protein [unclassified Streptomyces]|uniref:ABC transporter ATP-binding protein n=1 Tax=unclassified Streptomyces TaxID=2593676 RepID=UPI0036EBF207
MTAPTMATAPAAPSAPPAVAQAADAGGRLAMIRYAVRLGWSAARPQMIRSLVLLVASTLCALLYPIGITVTVNAVIDHQSDRLAVGIGLVAVMYTAGWLLVMHNVTTIGLLCDRVSVALSVRIAQLVNGVSGLEHFERPEYLTQLTLLDQKRIQFAVWPRHVLAVLQGLAQILGVAVVFVVIYPPLLVMPLCVLAAVYAERLAARWRERADESLATDRRLADDLMSLITSAASAKEIRVFGLAGELQGRHRDIARRVRVRTTRASVLSGLAGTAGWLVFAAAFCVAITVLAVRAVHGDTSPGAVVLAAILMQRAQTQTGPLANSIEKLLGTGETTRRLLWLEGFAAADRSAAVGTGGQAPPERLTGGITLHDVRFGYPGTADTVLDGIDLRLSAGAAVAIVGENGAGKSTLTKLLTGMYRPTGGRIEVDGVPLDDIGIADWRPRVSAGFQDYAKMQLPARETVGVGDLPRMSDDDALARALDRADATTVVEELPQGTETRLGSTFADGQDLSEGQWQRLALARAMMRENPLLLILDEPTASLDPYAEATLFERYLRGHRDLAARTGAITVLVSHRFSTVQMADHIVVLDGGRILEQGDHESLMAAGGRYAELFEMQAKSYR